MMEGELEGEKDKPNSCSDDDDLKQSSETVSPSGPLTHAQVSEKFEPGEYAMVPTEELSNGTNCTIIPLVYTRTHIRQEITSVQQTVTSVLSKLMSPPTLRAATNDDTLVGMLRDISAQIAMLHEAVKEIESVSTEKVFQL